MRSLFFWLLFYYCSRFSLLVKRTPWVRELAAGYGELLSSFFVAGVGIWLLLVVPRFDRPNLYIIVLTWLGLPAEFWRFVAPGETLEILYKSLKLFRPAMLDVTEGMLLLVAVWYCFGGVVLSVDVSEPIRSRFNLWSSFRSRPAAVLLCCKLPIFVTAVRS